MDVLKIIQQYADYSNVDIAHRTADGFAQKCIDFLYICEAAANANQKPEYQTAIRLLEEVRRKLMSIDNISILETIRLEVENGKHSK